MHTHVTSSLTAPTGPPGWHVHGRDLPPVEAIQLVRRYHLIYKLHHALPCHVLADCRALLLSHACDWMLTAWTGFFWQAEAVLDQTVCSHSLPTLCLCFGVQAKHFAAYSLAAACTVQNERKGCRRTFDSTKKVKKWFSFQQSHLQGARSRAYTHVSEHPEGLKSSGS